MAAAVALGDVEIPHMAAALLIIQSFQFLLPATTGAVGVDDDAASSVPPPAAATTSGVTLDLGFEVCLAAERERVLSLAGAATTVRLTSRNGFEVCG